MVLSWGWLWPPGDTLICLDTFLVVPTTEVPPVSSGRRQAILPSPFPHTGRPHSRKWSQGQLCNNWEAVMAEKTTAEQSVHSGSWTEISLLAAWQRVEQLWAAEQLLWKTTLLSLCENLEQSAAWKHLIWGVGGPTVITMGTKSQKPWAENLGEFSHCPMLFTFFQTSPQIPTLDSAGHWLLTVVFKFGLGSARSQATKVRLT